MLEPRPAHKNEVRRSSMNRRGKNEYRRQSGYKSCGPSDTSTTPATARGFRSPARGAHTQGAVQPARGTFPNSLSSSGGVVCRGAETRVGGG